MFFSVELLSKRDSGFGLLWLAATLGSKSSFRKLPKRSILTADIQQLCDLISHPSEPLALRLSSNLMFGVARVYKVKHEIFVSDVNNCFALLKKAVQDIHALGTAADTQLLMGQPSLRPDLVTLGVDPTIAIAMELEAFGALDVFAELKSQSRDDGDYDPHGNGKRRARTSADPTEAARAVHTLNEYHEHLLLSTSFEGNGSLGGLDASSSQVDMGVNIGSFAIEDDLFGPATQLGAGEVADIGDDLARELGDGWGIDLGMALDAPIDMDPFPSFNVGEDIATNAQEGASSQALGGHGTPARKGPSRKRPFDDSNKENMPPSSVQSQRLQEGPVNEFADAGMLDQFLGEDNFLPQALEVPMEVLADVNGTEVRTKPRNPKKVRLLLDARTELSDEELKAARENYIEGQEALRRELERKRQERTCEKAVDEILWGVPAGLEGPSLAGFWKDMFKVQVESRTGTIRFEDRVASPRKRQKTRRDNDIGDNGEQPPEAHTGLGQDDFPADFGGDMDVMQMQDFGGYDRQSQLRSSEEPERGRRGSAQAGNSLALDVEALGMPSSGTQRSAFFPWDGAGASSSVAGTAFKPVGGGSDRVSLDKVDIRLRSSPSGSKRDSLLPTSRVGSVTGLDTLLQDTQGEDFVFEAPGPNDKETQESDANLVTLERNSFNFLEYCKIQQNTQQTPLCLYDVAPIGTSTRRVAATALYHCLVLATKDLIRVQQPKPYEPIVINLK